MPQNNGLTITDQTGAIVAGIQVIELQAGLTVSGSHPIARVNSDGGGSAPPGTSALIASAIGVDLNTAGDTLMTLSAFATGKFFVVDYCIVTNADTSVSNFGAGVFSDVGGAGQDYGSADAAAITLTIPRDWATFGAGSANTRNGSNATMLNTAPIVNVATPEGSAATVDFYVYGRVFT